MISVIIPAYNAEKTIERAVKSAVRNIPNSEVIVVLNGCTDQTETIVRKLCDQYSNIRIYQSDKGVSNARNKGLDNVQSEWTMFLDADDYFEDGAEVPVANHAEQLTIDLWLFGHRAGNEIRKITNGLDSKTFEDNVMIARVTMLENPTRFMQVWGKLFRTDVIVQHHLRFNTGLSLSEDSDFTLRYTKFCRGIGFVPNIIYHYSLEPTSVMRQHDGRKIQNYIHAMEETEKEIIGEPEEIKHAYYYYVLMHMNIAMVREVFVVGSGVGSKSKQIELMKKTVGEKVFSDAINHVKTHECLHLRMLPILFLRMHMYGCAAFVYRVRAKQNARREGRQWV